MKLTTKIVHTFNIEDDSIDGLDFNVDIPAKYIKKKRTIIIEKKKTKFRTDASTRLF